MQRPSLPIATCLWSSPIGTLLLAGHERALCGIWFEDQRGIPLWALSAPSATQHPVLDKTIDQLEAYFSGRRRTFDIPLDTSLGTPFQQTVWQALQKLPFGQTTSYIDIARSIERPKAVRAVGGAVGKNPIGIIIPCHRVLGRDGSMTGYTGGLDRKVALLKLETA